MVKDDRREDAELEHGERGELFYTLRLTRSGI